MATFNQCILLMSLAITLSACGGGGGAGDTEPSVTEPDTQNEQGINGALSGHLYVVQETEGWVVDLSSGNASQMPAKIWWDTGEYTGSGIFFDAYPNQDASEFLLLVDNCLRGYNGSSGDFDCLSIINTAGDLVTNRAVLPDGIREASLSSDGNYIAIVYADESLVDPFAHLVIYDRAFSVIVSESTMRVTGGGQDSKYYARGLDWSSKGQLAYAYTKSIFVTSPYSAEGVPILTLSDSDSPMVEVAPFPQNPRFSPDGLKIAFQIYNSSATSDVNVPGNTIWVMNVVGTDLHQLAHYDGDLSFNNFAWSPNGEYILTLVGGTNTDPIAGGVSDVSYAIPSDSRNILVPYACDDANGIICVRTYFESPQSLSRKFDPYSLVLEWIE